MPGFFHTPITRSTFLKTTAAGAVALATGRLQAANDDEAHLALLSDTHIPADATNEYRGFRPVQNLNKVLPQVIAAAPQTAIINGDAARLTGQVEDYVALKAMLKPLSEHVPIVIGMGNHDDRDNFYKVFPGKQQANVPVDGKHIELFELGGTRFVVLDSLLYVDKVAGLLGKSQRTWLAKFLADSTDMPTVLFVHHTLEDGDGDLLDVDRLLAIVAPHANVKAIFYGHSHRYFVEQRGHVYLINQPAIGYNFNDEQPVGWLDAKFRPTGVEMTLHTVGGNEIENGKTKQISWT